MFDYITENFAGVLSKGDHIHLFDILVERYSGNRSMAARKIGVTNTATYQWKNAKYIKTETKKKILAANFEMDYLQTVKYILSRTSTNHTEILRMALQFLYNGIMQGNSKDEIIESIDEFMQVKKEHRGTIRDSIEFEFSDMLYNLDEKTADYGIECERTIEDFTGKEILDMLPLFLMHYQQNSEDYFTASKLLGLPTEELCKVWGNYNALRKETIYPPYQGGIVFGNQAGAEMFSYLKADEGLCVQAQNNVLIQMTSLGSVAVSLGGTGCRVTGNVVFNNASGTVLPTKHVITETQDGLCMTQIGK